MTVNSAYTRQPWYDTYWNAHKRTLEESSLAGRDVLLPTPTSDLTSFHPEPCSSDKVRQVYREMVRMRAGAVGLTHDEVDGLQLAGLRVYAANGSYTCGVPRKLRQTIGNCANEKTADTYTRHHRDVLTMIWRMIANIYEGAGDTVGVNTPHTLLCEEL